MLGLTDNQKGYTMIELVVSIAILAMIILPISGFFLNSVKTTKSAEEVLIASQLAQQYLESYKVKGINGVQGIGINDFIATNESGYTVKVFRGSNIAINNYSEENIGNMDFKINIETNGEAQVEIKKSRNAQDDLEYGSFSIASDNLVKLEVNESIGGLDITLTHNSITYTIPQINKGDIKLALICGGSRALRIDVNNNTNYNLNLYRVLNNKGSNAVTMSIKTGKAALINNNYIDVQNYNYTCPLTITVSKNNKVLAETNVLIR